jgi:N6-L-threonylcarbamoyladenine synthase
MKILALETSCDETACAIVVDGRHVLSSIISSQADFHTRYGGVIPEFAARQHLDTINYVVEDALKQANSTLDDIDAFAATLGPGLVGALLVGALAGKTLSFITQKPFLGVNHLYAHVASNYLDSDLEPPFLCLLVSGGHTQILHVPSVDTMILLGETLDDAVGEAYDKVARILGLPYPGGPALDKLAQTGDPKAFTLPQAKTQGAWDFSYSGLKTAVLRLYEREYPEDPAAQEVFKRNLAASFQETATNILVKKTLAAADELGLKTIAVAGGVAANSAVRAKFQEAINQRPGWRLFIPSLKYCTDNAAMVGASAFFNPITRDISMEVFSRSEFAVAPSP